MDEQSVQVEGVDVGIYPPPPTKKGMEYRIKGFVSETGDLKKTYIFWLAYSDGNPLVRRQTLDFSKGAAKKNFEFNVRV